MQTAIFDSGRRWIAKKGVKMKFTAAIRELVEKGSGFHLARMTESDYEAHLTNKVLAFEEAIRAVLVEGKTVRGVNWIDVRDKYEVAND